MSGHNPNPRPVVVGIDGQPGSAGALRYAVAEAKRRGAPLRVVHVIPLASLSAVVPIPPLPPLAPSVANLAAELETVGSSILHDARETARHLAPELVVTTKLARGSRSAALVEAAEDAQLVVVGRESRHGVDRLLTGATTAAVAGRAACDAVVVPSFWTDEHRRGRVVAGIKTQTQAHELLGTAFAEASALGATLTIVTAWELADPYLDRIEARTHSDEWEAEGREVLSTLLTDWRARFPDVPIDIQIKHGRAGTVLLAASRESDLLVLCRRRHGLHLHGHLGGVAYALLQASDVPVLVVPATVTDAGPAADLKLEEAGTPLK